MDARALHVIHIGTDRVVFKRGVRELLVSGEHTETLAASVLPLVDGSRNREDLVDAVPAPWRPAVEDFLDALTERGLLVEGPLDTDGGHDLGAAQDAFYGNFPVPATQARERLEAAEVVVVGLTHTGSALARGLRDAGVGRITVVTCRGLDSAATPVDVIDGGWSLDSDRGAGDRIVIAEEDGLVAAVEAATLTVACGDHGESEALLDVNRYALAAGRPFLPVWMSELVGHVGPLVYPFETACLRCYQLRCEANDANSDVSRVVRRAVAEDARLSPGMLPPMAGVVGGIAAMEVLKVLTEFAPSDAVARAIEINLVAFSTVVRRVLKLPRCPDCSDVMDTATISTRVGSPVSSVGAWVR